MKKIAQTKSATGKIEVNILDEIQNQTSIEKRSSGTKRDGAKIRKEIREKEANTGLLQNEVAHLEVEYVETEGKNSNLLAELREIEEQIDRENKMIDKYETEMKHRGEEMSKKQSEMDLLNRKYDRLLAQHVAAGASAEGEVGPMVIN